MNILLKFKKIQKHLLNYICYYSGTWT